MNKEARAEYMRNYRKSHPDFYKKHYAMVKAWRKRNHDKAYAHKLVQNALLSGKLKRPETCKNCKATEIHAHHEDYTKPLEVNWYCDVHHKLRHKEMTKQLPTKHKERI